MRFVRALPVALMILVGALASSIFIQLGSALAELIVQWARRAGYFWDFVWASIGPTIGSAFRSVEGPGYSFSIVQTRGYYFATTIEFALSATLVSLIWIGLSNFRGQSMARLRRDPDSYRRRLRMVFFDIASVYTAIAIWMALAHGFDLAFAELATMYLLHTGRVVLVHDTATTMLIWLAVLGLCGYCQQGIIALAAPRPTTLCQQCEYPIDETRQLCPECGFDRATSKARLGARARLAWTRWRTNARCAFSTVCWIGALLAVAGIALQSAIM